MNPQPISNRGLFLKSPHHAWMGLATLGAGFMTGEPFFLLVGAAAYALGWIYLPDTGWFRRYIERKHQAADQARAQAELAAFNQRRDALLNSLNSSGRERYFLLAGVCREIELATQDDPMRQANQSEDPRLRKLDELMWAYLRMLKIEENLQRHLETERREIAPQSLTDAEEELRRLTLEYEALKKQGAPVATLDVKEKLINSRLERLEVVRSRLQKMEQVQANLRLVLSEQDRLDQQIKLIRAENLANQNTSGLSDRIDASFEQLSQTNQWLAEMEQFRDPVGSIPSLPLRVGYVGSSGKTPPQIPEKSKRQAQCN